MTAPTQCDHDRAKRDSQWPKLEPVGVQVLGDLELELRNCRECCSTLAREVRR